MRSGLLVLVAFLLCLPAISWAMEVEELSLARGIEQRQPVDVLEVVPADIGRLYCFTRVTGAQEDTRIAHVWYWQEREMARVELPVRSGNWRTWSSKRILPEWTGDWRLVVEDASGQPLAEMSFRVESL
ncbi:MAG: DUF2914 domain-containing protein [Deltaproteobacteria bacterium]|nr:MAG: DUF2914 domain-containing protein [Deltaproteobacteria bacterium]